MDQAGIIRDLLSWLDSHLDQPLSLDNVAAKADYSKWHLQRMFKEVTCHAIGAYISRAQIIQGGGGLAADEPANTGYRASVPFRFPANVYPRF